MFLSASELPGEVFAMTESRKKKVYVIETGQDGTPMSGCCNGCGQRFRFEETVEGKQIEKAFHSHDCGSEMLTSFIRQFPEP